MPKTNHLIGQEDLKKSLEVFIGKSAGNVLIFFGPKGIGKHSFAKEFAMGVLCKTENKFGGCKLCVSCKYIDAMSHPDYKEILLLDNDKTIKTENVRKTLCSDICLMPQISDKKVYFIEGDYLNEQSQNAILKTLEELPEYAKVIVSTSSLQRLLPTLLSRSVPIYFHRNSNEEIKKILKENNNLDDDLISFYTKIADGIPGTALELADDEYVKEARTQIFEILFSVPKNSLDKILLVDYTYFEKNKNNIDDIFVIINSWIRDLLILKVTKDKGKLINEDQFEKLIEFLNEHKITKNKLYNSFEIIFSASKGLKQNAGFENCISNMLVQLRKELSYA